MKKFFLSRYTKFDFNLFDFQHICLIIITIIGLILIYKYRKKIINLKEVKIKKIRYLFVFIILINMFLYRGSYLYYGVYNIKIHLSLYYCHLVNYIFVFFLFLNYKKFYKISYILCWIGAFWTVLFPDISGGIDCFIFYCSFISHNLVLIFVTFMVVVNKLKITIKDLLIGIFICFILFFITYLINIDFGTNFNSPYSILKDYVILSEKLRYLLLFVLGLISAFVSYVLNKFYMR